ncbi:MAG: tetratricopeptide repeat protein, partial [Phycisphaerae bacterium]|nr:tetratricopeptide repeat protein [Phycisphaerae bacterium]NIU11970.1 tetratricopeptide repeat protein [Phycisphaerae bacterium]NIU59780.1 tetratricopeptide repeat protein [Phycisphaerae bacterium]NIW96130.1 tetratricopeptide repeat protein [Phycisphaerae bacterium]
MLAAYNWFLAHLGQSPEESIEKAFEMVQKALSVDESDATSLALLSSIYVVMRQYEKAIDAGERSIALAPNASVGYGNLGSTLCYAGRIDEGIDILKQGIRLNPFPDQLFFLNLGRCNRQRGQYEEALIAYKKALSLSPNNIFNHMSLAAIYALLDRQGEAE